MLNTELVKQMYYDGATVDEKRTLKRVKNLTRIETNPSTFLMSPILGTLTVYIRMY